MINTCKMTPISEIATSEFEYSAELLSLAKEAEEFLISHSWCNKITDGFFDRGWGYILGVFFFVIEPDDKAIPTCFWVIVGDIPPAYIDVEDNPNGACAIDAYVLEMQKWIDHVKQHQPVTELIPVNVPPTEEYAEMLQSRIDVIKNDILANYKEEIEAGLCM